MTTFADLPTVKFDHLEDVESEILALLPPGTLRDRDGDIWAPSPDGIYRGYAHYRPSWGTLSDFRARLESVQARANGSGRTREQMMHEFTNFFYVLVPDAPVETDTAPLADWERDLLSETPAEDPQVRELRIQLEQARAELVRSNAHHEDQMESLKRIVAEVAMEKAEEHDWCEVVQRALEDMGLGAYIPTREFEVVVMVEHRLRVTANGRSAARHLANEDQGWINQTFSVQDDGEIYSDSDVEIEEVERVSIDSITVSEA